MAKTSKIIAKNYRAIGIIAVEENDKWLAAGTGFVVSSSGDVVTCAHVYDQIPTEKKSKLVLKLPDPGNKPGLYTYKSHPLSIVKVEQDTDTAILSIKLARSEKLQTVRLAKNERLKEGDAIIFAGYPLAMQFVNFGMGITINTNQAIVSATKFNKDGNFTNYLIDSHINPGSSGSPVFSLNSGKVIGKVSGSITNDKKVQNETIKVPAGIGILTPVSYKTK